MHMNRSQFWKNFRLGEELDISGAFIYNGLRRFQELPKLDHSTDIFEVFYQLSIGLERLMKIAIVLLEHDYVSDKDAYESGLSTHNHQALLARIQGHTDLGLSRSENAFLHILTNFYKNLRYDRFSITSSLDIEREKRELLHFLERHLQVKFDGRDTMLGHQNTDQFKKFIRNIVLKIARRLYNIIAERARGMGLYTYELRSGSKAETVFLREGNVAIEQVVWKELLVYFMNTKDTSGYLEFLRGIEPLPFDPALVQDYLDCFQSASLCAQVIDEMEALYEDIADPGERLRMLSDIGAPNVYFHGDGEDAGFDDEVGSFDDPPGE